jgi:hypothetical protein
VYLQKGRKKQDVNLILEENCLILRIFSREGSLYAGSAIEGEKGLEIS